MQRAPLDISLAQMFQMLLVLGFILVIIFGLAYFYRRFVLNRVSGGGKRSFLLHATYPVGTRERVVLIEVEGKKMLLGVTNSSVTMLHLFESNSSLENGKQ